MKQTKLVPFDLEKAKRGAKVVTRKGYPVRLGLFDLKGEHSFPITGAIDQDDKEEVQFFTAEGKWSKLFDESDLDLFIEVEEEADDYNPYKEVVKSISDMVERYSDADSDLIDFYDNVKVKCREAVEYAQKWCKKQEEQKTSDGLKIMPDKWYTCIEMCHSNDIIDFAEGHYYLGSDILKYKGLLKEDEDYKDFFRPWNINDAKPGDVLYSTGLHNDCIFIFNGLDNYDEPDGDRAVATGYCCLFVTADKIEFGIQGPDCIEVNTTTPATQAQRDLLFQKIKEAGYEWNADKKELHKIEKVKTRRMTNQELSWWLRDCPEEHREWRFNACSSVYTSIGYSEEKEHNPVANNILIRRNGEEWQEPLIEE